AARRPRPSRVPGGLPGMSPVRLVEVDDGLFAAVADAPLGEYDEAAIERHLRDTDWISRAALAHAAVVEAFVSETAVLPMKLFTLFTSDDRAVENLRAGRRGIAAIVARVANHQEWGIRVVLDRERAAARTPVKKARATGGPGLAYLARE